MSSKDARHCPQCGSAMSYRLGEYDCPSCGHSEAAVQPKEERGWGSSSDSINRAKLIAPPPPAPGAGGGYNLGGTPPDGMYGGGAPTGRVGGGPLHTEKIIFMGIQLVGTVVLIVLVATAGAVVPGAGDGLGTGAIITGLLIGALINLVLYGLVLFSNAIWLKWTCLGCQTFGLISIFVGMCAPSMPGQSLGSAGLDGIVRFFQLIFVAWFASIIYRDIMEQQQY